MFSDSVASGIVEADCLRRANLAEEVFRMMEFDRALAQILELKDGPLFRRREDVKGGQQSPRSRAELESRLALYERRNEYLNNLVHAKDVRITELEAQVECMKDIIAKLSRKGDK